MNKLLLSAAVTAAMFAGQAQALPLSSSVPDIAAILSGTHAEVWISGSSAATPFLEKAIAADCATGATLYKYTTSGDFTWICDSALATGTVNIVHKRDGGGSVTGVKSALVAAGKLVASGNLPSYWVTSAGGVAGSVATSNGVTVTPVTPSATTQAAHQADLDLADVDGAQFENAANGGVTNASTLTATGGALATQIFGVVVNTRLYAAMQVASVAAGKIAASCISTTLTSGVNSATFTTPTNNTDACMPSLSVAQLSAILGNNRTTDWYNLAFTDASGNETNLVNVQFATDVPANSDIHYCSRTAGSGTLATFNIKLENQCFKGNEAMPTASSQTLGAETDGTLGNQKVVHSMSGSGDLENCLIGLNDWTTNTSFTPLPAQTNGAGFRWAIGIMSLDRNSDVSKKYRFIKVDGYAPTAVNVVNGNYKIWAELVNLNPVAPIASGAGSTASSTLAADILANIGKADQIASLNVIHPFGLSGFLGTATNPSFLPTFDQPTGTQKAYAAFDSARPVNPWTHSTSTGGSLNHCRTPSVPTGAKAVRAFN